MLYHYLFYKGYQAAVRSRNYGGMPALGGCGPVGSCVLMHVLSLTFVLERLLGWDIGQWLKPEYKWFYSVVAVALPFLYYLRRNRYEDIVEKYDRLPAWRDAPPVGVLFIYFVLSGVGMFLAAVYRNHGWLFR
jgi:hypothetical protein